MEASNIGIGGCPQLVGVVVVASIWYDGTDTGDPMRTYRSRGYQASVSKSTGRKTTHSSSWRARHIPTFGSALHSEPAAWELSDGQRQTYEIRSPDVHAVSESLLYRDLSTRSP